LADQATPIALPPAFITPGGSNPAGGLRDEQIKNVISRVHHNDHRVDGGRSLGTPNPGSGLAGNEAVDVTRAAGQIAEIRRW